MTPNGVDQDYNFITSLERKLDEADRDAEGRGIALRAQPISGYKNHKSGFARGEVQMEQAIQRMGVIVDRAPKGMTRSKENSTKWHKKSCNRLGR